MPLTDRPKYYFILPGGGAAMSAASAAALYRDQAQAAAAQATAVALFSRYADVSNSGTGDTTLYSDTIPAAVLSQDGAALIAEYGLTFANNANTKTVRVKFDGTGSTTIFNSGALTNAAAGSMTIRMLLVRESASVVRYTFTVTATAMSTTSFSTTGRLTGLTLSNAQTLILSGQSNTASNDITATMARAQVANESQATLNLKVDKVSTGDNSMLAGNSGSTLTLKQGTGGAILDGKTGVIAIQGGVLSTTSAGLNMFSGLATGQLTTGTVHGLSTYLDSHSVEVSAGSTQKTGISIEGQTSSFGSTVRFWTANAERGRFTSGGNLLIGGTTNITGSGGLKIFGTTDSTDTTTGAFQCLGGGSFAKNLFVGANVVLSPPSAASALAVNGQVTFELTNNTTLTFKARGSDGTTRSGTVPLA